MKQEDFDSQEEWYFYNWLIEADEAGLISNPSYQPKTYELCPRVSIKYEKQLKTKTKIVDKFLFHPHSYTPDFRFYTMNGWLDQYFITPSYSDSICVFVDIKGGWSRDNRQKAFSINQKWMLDKFGIYVEKVIPEKLFKKTWVPQVCRFSPKKRQPVKKYIGVLTINEFLEGLKK